MVRLGALIGDGHTYVNAWRTYRFFPLGVNWFGSDLRVTRTAPVYSRALGAPVVGIEDEPLAQVKTRLNQLIPQGETEGYVLNASAFFILSAEALKALGITKSLPTARWTFADDKGKKFTLDIMLSKDTRHQNASGSHPSAALSSTTGGRMLVHISFRFADCLPEL